MERILRLEIEELEERIAPTFPGFTGLVGGTTSILGGGESQVKLMDASGLATNTVVGVLQEPAHSDPNAINHTPIDVSDSATAGLTRAVAGG